MPSARHRFATWPTQKPPAGSLLDWDDPLAGLLVACWPFWEGSGYKVADVVGNYDATFSNLTGTIFHWSGDRIVGGAEGVGASMYSGGVARTLKRIGGGSNGERLALNRTLTLAAASRYSIEVLFSYNGTTTGPLLSDDTSNAGLKVQTNGSVILNSGFFNASSTLNINMSAGLQHVVVTSDPASDIRYYVNGVPAGSAATPALTTVKSLLGNAGTRSLNGQCALIRVWRGRILTPREVVELYLAPYRMFVPGESSLRTFAPVPVVLVRAPSAPLESLGVGSVSYGVPEEHGGLQVGLDPVESLAGLASAQVVPIDSDGAKVRQTGVFTVVDVRAALRRTVTTLIDASGAIDFVDALFDLYAEDFSPVSAFFDIFAGLLEQDHIDAVFDILEGQDDVSISFDIIPGAVVTARTKPVQSPVVEVVIS